jgi:hypothetical protein
MLLADHSPHAVHGLGSLASLEVDAQGLALQDITHSRYLQLGICSYWRIF